jgi:5-methylcytosine-specific restriction endonuclease McrA
MMKYCLTCSSHHPVGLTCPRREAQRYAMSRERRARGTAKWKKARALARQRDHGRCVYCGSDRNLQVHHRTALKDGGAKYDLGNLETVCSSCHAERHRGEGATRKSTPVYPALALREFNSGKVDDEILIG